jgi:uncharacterized protein
VRTPVWFAAAEGALWAFSAGEAGKVKRLRRSPRVRIAPCDARGRIQGEWRDATARLVREPAAIERARAAMRAKYGWQVRLLDVFSRLARRIESRAWIRIET